MDNLEPLLGKSVTVTATIDGIDCRWNGRLVALADEPTAVIQQANGVRISLPQSYTYATATERDPVHVELAAAKATLQDIAAFADELDSYCSPHGVASLYAERLRERLNRRR